MNFFATSWRVQGLACRAAGRYIGTALLALTAGSVTSAAFAEDDVGLEARAQASFGGSLDFIDSPYDNDFVGGFWDQYRHTRKKNHDPAYFVDLLHFDLGLARDDDTYLGRVEGWSPNHDNERVEIDGNFEGLRLDLDYRNFRSEELRYFPRGTFQDDTPPPIFFPFAFATQYTPDASLAETLDRNLRFWVRRSGVSGEIRLRPEDFGSDLPVLDQMSIRSGYERRKGYRQDSFLLHVFESADENQRFRGNRRRIDQEVTSVGSNFVLTPAEGVVADLDLSFESFRENAGVVTFRDLAAADPAIPPPLGNIGLRAFNFVPDTDRLSGSLRVDGKLGPAAVQAGGFITHLRQTNQAPLQRALELDKQEVTSWSAHGSFELALDHDLELTGTAKFSERRIGLDANDLADQRQLGPILRRRSELDTQIELSLRPRAGTLVATGYRYDWIDRRLRYPEPGNLGIDRAVALITGNGEAHNLYLRGRARLLRRLQISGELGWKYRPERDYPRDMTYSVYFDARGAYTLLRPIPLSLSIQGGVRDGHGNGRVISSAGTQARKDLDRLQWNYSATLTAVPASGTTLTLSFVQQQDNQDTPYQRTDYPRPLDFTTFLPSPDRIHYDSGVRSLSFGGRQKLTDSLEIRGFANLTWVEADLDGDNPTGSALDRANEIRSRILSTGVGIGLLARDGLRFDVGYRFDEYLDRRERAPIGQDDRRHSLHFGVTANLDLITGRAAD